MARTGSIRRQIHGHGVDSRSGQGRSGRALKGEAAHSVQWLRVVRGGGSFFDRRQGPGMAMLTVPMVGDAERGTSRFGRPPWWHAGQGGARTHLVASTMKGAGARQRRHLP
jgi:hypothetical protein